MGIENIEGIEVVENIEELCDRRVDILNRDVLAEFGDNLLEIVSIESVPVHYGVRLKEDGNGTFSVSYYIDLLRNGICVCRTGSDYQRSALDLARRFKESGLGDFFIVKYSELPEIPDDPRLLRQLEKDD